MYLKLTRAQLILGRRMVLLSFKFRSATAPALAEPPEAEVELTDGIQP